MWLLILWSVRLGLDSDFPRCEDFGTGHKHHKALFRIERCEWASLILLVEGIGTVLGQEFHEDEIPIGLVIAQDPEILNFTFEAFDELEKIGGTHERGNGQNAHQITSFLGKCVWKRGQSVMFPIKMEHSSDDLDVGIAREKSHRIVVCKLLFELAQRGARNRGR